MRAPVVKVENLIKRYKELVALDHFHLEINEGEIFGLLGPNGSGKTTTINCILSLLSYSYTSNFTIIKNTLLTGLSSKEGTYQISLFLWDVLFQLF